MSKHHKLQPVNKNKLIRQSDHLTTPPRLEGVVKNAKMNPIKKQKGQRPKKYKQAKKW